MQTYSSLPKQVADSWSASSQTHPALEHIDFHYHEVEEWLEVLRGEITFSSLSRQKSTLAAGSVFQIPRGEVHEVDIGAGGVEYRMYVPLEVTAAFTKALSLDEVEMLRTNLKFPVQEENIDGRAAEFFAIHLSDALTFCRGDGKVVKKDEFLGRFTARDRSASGTVCVLNRTPNGVLVSTVVTVDTSSPAPKHFTNIRHFAKENGHWKCRVWVNFPETSVGSAIG